MSSWSRFACVLTVALAATGCARSHGGHGGGGSPLGLVPVERGTLTADVAAVPSLAHVDRLLGYPRPAGNYQALGPDECQCLAVRAAQRANLLDAERRALAAAESQGLCARGGNELTYDVLRTAAIEDRNRAAGDALNAYYLLARSEAQLDIVGHALVDARQAMAGFDRAGDQGLMVKADKTEFPRREIELRNQQAQLQNSIGQLNAQLWHLIGIPPDCCDQRIWPTTDLAVMVEAIDVCEAVQVGLATRAELGLLRRACYCLDKDSVASARAALSQVSPLLGMSPAQPECKGVLGVSGALKSCLAQQRELPQRQQQICQYARQREAEIAVEIRQNVATVELRLRQVALAKETLAQWSLRHEELQARSGTGGATFADVSGARLLLAQARADLVARVVDWKIALARLKQSQGLLAAECCP